MIQALASGVAALKGWRRWLAAAGLGALAAGAMPPVSATPVLLIAFPGLVWLLDGARGAGGAARDGWWFGFGFLVAGLYWIANALLVDAARFGWLVPFAVLVVPAGLAVFVAAGTAFAKLFWARGAVRVLALAVSWTAAELLRGHVLTGFPWNLVGYTWSWSDAMLQGASLVGAYGLSLATVAVAASPAAPWEPGRGPVGRSAWSAPVAAAVLVAVAGAWGAARLGGASDEAHPGVMLRVVQANITRTQKWDPALREENLRRHLALSEQPGHQAVTHIVWPETAVPFLLSIEPEIAARLGAVVPPGGLLLAGTLRTELGEDGRIANIWNSVQAVDASGALVAAYDKAHLVPFGEYVPLRGMLSALGLGGMLPGALDYSAGPGARTLALSGLPRVSPLVCYEAIFPGAVVPSGDRPDWMLNLTNDGWYGRSAGPYQHFAMARVRAVEEGLPLVRAANTGISAVVDAWGRIRARLDLGETAVLDSPLPVAAPPTLYARYGLAIPLGLWVVCALVLGAIRWRLPRGRYVSR